MHTELNLGQRSFEKCKPWYVRVNITLKTCCCRYHIKYGYYYDTYKYIFHVLHNTLVQECSSILPPTSSREFIQTILCSRTKGCTYYQKTCLYGTCPRCVGFTLLSKCVHVSDDHELGQMEINSQRFEYITYDLEGGK